MDKGKGAPAPHGATLADSWYTYVSTNASDIDCYRKKVDYVVHNTCDVVFLPIVVLVPAVLCFIIISVIAAIIRLPR